MRLHLGAIPESADFTNDGGWRPIREPGPVLMQFLALPVGIALMALFAFSWVSLLPADLTALPASSVTLSPLALLLSFPGIIVVHELLHAAVHPAWGTTPASVIGVWPSKLLFYAHFEGALSRNRFLAVFLAPLFCISLLPLALAAVLQLPPTPALTFVAWCSILNALLACGDMLGMALIGLQVPAGAEVRNLGWRSFWRPRLPAA